MKKKAASVYLYLTRRDRSAVRIISVMGGTEQPPVRISDLKVLQLPADMHGQLDQIIHNERMMWEPWIESAATFQELRDSLRRRGYGGLPVSGQPEMLLGFFSKPVKPAQKNIPIKKTMIRKKN